MAADNNMHGHIPIDWDDKAQQRGYSSALSMLQTERIKCDSLCVLGDALAVHKATAGLALKKYGIAGYLPGGRKSIVWQDFYYLTSSVTHRGFLRKIYARCGSLRNVERLLGITAPTFRAELIKHGIPMKPVGGRNNNVTPVRDRVLAVQDTEGKTGYEIAREAEASIGYTFVLLRRHGRKCIGQRP